LYKNLILIVFLSVACSKNSSVDFDILIKGGTIVDGTGNPGTRSDIGVLGDRIVEIGDLTGKTASRTIDASGMVVSPGFIDMHTHCDDGLGDVRSNANLNYLSQGVTTVVTGNCGSGTHEIAATKAKWESQGIGTNAVHLVGFGDVRRIVMGEESRSPTPEEQQEIKSIVRQAMNEGAWGMSTGLEYIPDRYSTIEEIIEVTKVVGEFGGFYASHQRNEFDAVPQATQETIRIAEAAGVRAVTSHFKVCRKKYWGVMKEAVDLINDARTKGIDIVADMYPYHFASGGPVLPIDGNADWAPFHLPGDMEPFAGLRNKLRDENLKESDAKQLMEQYVQELARALSDESKRAKIRESVLVGTPDKPSSVAIAGWDSYLVVIARKNEPLLGKILSDLAEEQGRDPFDVAADLVLDEPDLYVACGVMSEDDMTYAMKQDWLMFSSDGDALPIVKEADEPIIAHPRSFASQARVLRKYVREDKVLTLEHAVKKMTSLPAGFLQMKDRGLLKEGYKADLAIFDPETVTDNATHADARRYSTGIEYVLLDGKVAIDKSQYDGALHGKLLLREESSK
jgi:N-acyl-D-aspartate/D-glutamate deacylase